MDVAAPTPAAENTTTTTEPQNPKGKGKTKTKTPNPKAKAKGAAKAPQKVALDLVSKGALAVVDANSLHQQCIQGNVCLDSTTSDSDNKPY